MKRSSIHTHGLALQLGEVATHQLVDEIVVVRVVAEHHVATDVVGEARLVGERRGEATDVVVRLRMTQSSCPSSCRR
jgi:hypothetical protein